MTEYAWLLVRIKIASTSTQYVPNKIIGIQAFRVDINSYFFANRESTRRPVSNRLSPGHKHHLALLK
jgi:hypothetical protein